MICTDSSVAAKWTFVEAHSGEARALLRDALARQEPIVAPPLLPSEVATIIRQRMRQGQVRLDEARALLTQFLALPITLQAPGTLYDRALVLADRHNLPAVYDAHYVALAELLGATLWTADQRLLRALSGRLPFVRSIADYGTSA
jgi:predicted nucleic acid-binding protein